jgi:hypothetical protein
MSVSTAVDRSLGIRSELSLTVEQLEMLRSLESYDLWFVEERLARKGIVTQDSIPAAILEFRRYMALVGLGYRGLGMLSPEVDEVWHAFILFTREYAAFCQEAFGTFIHHVPRTTRTPLPQASAENFLTAYEEVFGVVPVEWVGSAMAKTAAMGDEPSGCGTEDCTDG